MCGVGPESGPFSLSSPVRGGAIGQLRNRNTPGTSRTNRSRKVCFPTCHYFCGHDLGHCPPANIACHCFPTVTAIHCSPTIATGHYPPAIVTCHCSATIINVGHRACHHAAVNDDQHANPPRCHGRRSSARSISVAAPAIDSAVSVLGVTAQDVPWNRIAPTTALLPTISPLRNRHQVIRSCHRPTSCRLLYKSVTASTLPPRNVCDVTE